MIVTIKVHTYTHLSCSLYGRRERRKLLERECVSYNKMQTGKYFLLLLLLLFLEIIIFLLLSGWGRIYRFLLCHILWFNGSGIAAILLLFLILLLCSRSSTNSSRTRREKKSTNEWNICYNSDFF